MHGSKFQTEFAELKEDLMSLLDLSFATFKSYVEDSLSQRCLIKMHLFDIFLNQIKPD